MDTTWFVELFLRLPAAMQDIIMLVLIGSFLVSHIVSTTATPAPNTTWGRIYHGLEVFAGLYGRAKEIGIPVPEKPTIDDLLKEVSALKAALAAPQAVSTTAPTPIIHEASNA
ncbi:MAG: hypothetical protein F8N37_11975 [Telmatospirillum sp.]|nr:hypothetical protein [Telmatospirillum sp.]